MLHGRCRLQQPLRGRQALEAAVAVALTTGALTLAGHARSGLIASMGAFSIFYFAGSDCRTRLCATAGVACGLVAASLLGGWTGPGGALTVAVLALIAGLATAVLERFQAGPPGALMFVLVAGVSGRMATSLAVAHVAALIALGCVMAYTIVLVGHCGRAVPLTPGGRRPRIPTTCGHRRCACCSRLRWAAHSAWPAASTGRTGRKPRPWPCSLGLGAQAPVRRALHRMVGTVLGIGLFTLILTAQPRGLWLCLALAALQGAGEALVAAHYALAMMFITPVALLIGSGADPAMAWATVQARLLDMASGAGAALVIALASRAAGTRRRTPP